MMWIRLFFNNLEILIDLLFLIRGIESVKIILIIIYIYKKILKLFIYIFS